jgi:hypothetical protein
VVDGGECQLTELDAVTAELVAWRWVAELMAAELEVPEARVTRAVMGLRSLAAEVGVPARTRSRRRTQLLTVMLGRAR